ncbi:MAG: methionyl-tRNA formyltransferase [Porticoccaceae bacterium]
MTGPDPDARELRIAFAGTPDFAAVHLRALLDAGCNVIAVYTQPDRPAGRGKKLTPSPVKQIALDHGLAIHQPETLRDSAAQATFAALRPDIMIVVAYGLIIPQAVLDTPKHGCINVHASLLPRWRGAAPIQRAIEAGDRETGVTIMQMDAGLDTGAMLHKVACDITADDTGGSLHDKLAALGPAALLTALADIAAERAHGQPQDDALSTYAHKISKEEAAVDWTQDAAAIARKVRAFNPFPVAFTRHGATTLRLWRAHALSTTARAAAGEILAVDGDGMTVACGEDALLVSEAQLPGKRAMAIADMVRGNPDLFTPGQRLGKDPA